MDPHIDSFFFSFLAYDVKQVASDLHYFNNGLDECYFFSTLNLCVYIYSQCDYFWKTSAKITFSLFKYSFPILIIF